MLAYADYGASYTNAANALWIPLAEKAYAQWNQTGKEGRDGTNSYRSIQGGWMATVDAQVLGYNATDYIMTTTSEQVAVNALAAGDAVTIGTASWSRTPRRPLREPCLRDHGLQRRQRHLHPLQSLGVRSARANSPGASSRRPAPSFARPSLPAPCRSAAPWARLRR